MMQYVKDSFSNFGLWLLNKFILTAALGMPFGALQDMALPNPYLTAVWGAIKSVFWFPIQATVLVKSALEKGLFAAIGERIGEAATTFLIIAGKFTDTKLNDFGIWILYGSVVFSGIIYIIYWRLELNRQRVRDFRYFKRKSAEWR